LLGIWQSLFGLCFLALDSYIAARLYYRLSTLPHAEAEILHGEIYSQVTHLVADTASANPVYGFRCSVRFPVGQQMRTSQVDIGYQESNRAEMWDWYSRFPTGTRAMIAYDPADPSRVLFAGDFTTAYARVFCTLWLFGWITFAGLLAVWLSRQLMPPPPAQPVAGGV
jgi:hypothetical protein